MIKKLIVQVVATMSFMSVAGAAPASAPAFQLKDLSYRMTGKNSMEVMVGKEKVKLEKMSNKSFQLNNQVVTWDKNDTMEQLQSKIEKAYMASQKKGASLESFLLPRAHAMGLIFPALLGGMFGFMLGNETCQNSTTAPSSMPEVAPVNTFEQ